MSTCVLQVQRPYPCQCFAVILITEQCYPGHNAENKKPVKQQTLDWNYQ